MIFQRSLQLPERRVARSADGVERQTRPRLAAIALDLQPAQSAVNALPDRRRRLRGLAVAFHADRPCLRLRAVGRAGGFPGGFAGSLGAHLRAMIRPPQMTSRDLVLMAGDYSGPWGAGNATRI